MLSAKNFYITCLKLGLISNATSSSNIATKPQHIWVGFSGGLDSRVLLQLAYVTFNSNPNYKLHAVYINHGVNKNANVWQEHCRKVCQQLNVDFQAVKLTIQQQNNANSNMEHQLRSARIKIWKKLVAVKDTLLLAHNLNDQAETFLLRLCRGSGLRGLASIKAINYLGNLKIVRPLLRYSREQIEQYANIHKLSYVTDPSNFDRKFTRNFIRHDILPLLTKYWPTAISNISKSADRLQQVDDYINKKAKNGLVNCYGYTSYYNDQHNGYDTYYIDTKYLIINKLLQYDLVLQKEILRQFIVTKGFYSPSEEQLNTIYREIIYSKIDSKPRLLLSNYIVTRYRNNLYVYPKQYLAAKSTKISRGWINKLGELTIYFGKSANVVDLGKAKKIFQQLGIPAWQRYDYPLVFRQNKLLAIIGLWNKGLYLCNKK